jgi:hypothetical protein
MKKLLMMLAAVTVTFTVAAQYKKDKKNEKKEEKRKRIDALIKQEEEGVIAYNKHSVGGIKLTTDGYGAFFEIGRSKSVKKAWLYQLEISERKHNKEEKINNFSGFAAPFIYGKLNYFYPVKLGIQQQILLGNKSNKNGLSITGNFGGGISVGLLRPYVLEVEKNGERAKVRYDSPDSLLFVNAYTQTLAATGPNIGDGWKNLKVTPGLYFKPSVRFDYGRMNELVSAIEVGINAEFYAKKIPQMLYNKERQFFFGAYFAMVFGRRK